MTDKNNIYPDRFFGLHAHCGMSSYDGFGSPAKHMDFILSNNGNGLAFTDHGNMNHFDIAYKYYQGLKKKGINFKYIPGVESYIHPSLEEWKELKSKNEQEKERLKALKKEKKKNNEEKEPSVYAEMIEEEGTSTIEDENESKRVFNPLNKRHHLVILPKNSQGLKDLYSLVSFSYTEGLFRMPRVDHKILREINKNKNLIGLSACLAGNPSFLMFQDCLDINWDDIDFNIIKERQHIIMPKLRNMVDEYVKSFGEENYFLEIQFNKLKPQHAINYLLIELSKETGIQLVATADSHYPSPDKWKAREMYKRIRPGGFTNTEDFPKSIDDLKCELYPKNSQQMWEEYQKHKPEYDFYNDQIIYDAIERSYDIAWDYIGEIDPDSKVQYPSFVCPKNKNPIDYLREKAEIGLKEKNLHINKEYVDRLNLELDVIDKKNFALYFLTMKEIIDTLNEHMLIGAGRGSSSGSLLCYCLGITKIDPIKYKLLFARFLNFSREDQPDIDCDVSDKDLAFKILQQKYGEDNVIAISNINTLGFKSLVKDLACKFFNIPYEEVNQAVKNIDIEIKKGCKIHDVEFNPKMINVEYAKKYSSVFLEFIEKYPELEEYINDLSGEQKSIGRHAGGILIADSIGSKMPVITSKRVRQTPWNKKYLEDFGWLKFDLLGLETLKIVENCISLILDRKKGIKSPTFKQINEYYEKNLLPDVLDLEDQNVYKHIYKDGYYAGIFQTTNKDTQKFFSAAEPKSIEDISDLTALYRPGPMDVNAHWDYIEKKHGRKKIEYHHELEKEFLGDTAGLVVFQEQMMFMMNKIGDLDLIETDTFRKVVSKKPVKGDPLYDQMLQYKDKFINGAISKDISRETAIDIWNAMEAFAGYAFNKCLHKDTLIETQQRGYIKISDIKIGEYVNSRNGWVKVLDVIYQGKKQLWQWHLGCSKSLLATLDHKVETIIGAETIMIPLRDFIDNYKIKDGPVLINNKDQYNTDCVDFTYIKFATQSIVDDTYDLEVDHPSHSFYANDISVSNSHSISYSYNSYLTAWLCTYYEPEWLCAYIETQIHKPEEKAKAISEIRRFGYDLSKLDINLMDSKWTILDGEKKLVPSGVSCKGIGLKALEEIKSLRPYKSIYDFLWNKDGGFKHSKFNKRNVEALIKIEAFDSLDCVGDNKLFKNYAHMYRTLLEGKNWDLLKKKLKKDTYETQINKLEQLAINADKSDWSLSEKLSASTELLGQPNIDIIISKATQRKLSEKRYVSLNEFDEDEGKGCLTWFIISDFIKRKTKHGSPFYIIEAYGSIGILEKIYLWEILDGFDLKKNYGYIGLIEKNQYGFSTKARYIKELKNNNFRK